MYQSVPHSHADQKLYFKVILVIFYSLLGHFFKYNPDVVDHKLANIKVFINRAALNSITALLPNYRASFFIFQIEEPTDFKLEN